ncbi:hypothetical protein FHG87_007705 [Trinorchestia longiramus]|nr:hypothetical protein FHG87_007705 [Trinorchestia longiramus]
MQFKLGAFASVIFLALFILGAFCSGRFTIHLEQRLPLASMYKSFLTESRCECKLHCMVSQRCAGSTYDESRSRKRCYLVEIAYQADLINSSFTTISFLKTANRKAPTEIPAISTTDGSTISKILRTTVLANTTSAIPVVGNRSFPTTESSLTSNTESSLASNTETSLAPNTKSSLASNTPSSLASNTASSLASSTESSLATNTESSLASSTQRLSSPTTQKSKTSSAAAKSTSNATRTTEARKYYD